jgi:hypothetical protein
LLPERPGRALVFSNNATESNFGSAIAAACRQRGIALEFAGLNCGRPCERPEALLPEFDLVFAKGRAALEAMAVGCAVIVVDFQGVGGLVVPARFDAGRRLNFGAAMMLEAVTPENVGRHIDRFSTVAAADVSARVRAEAGLDEAIERLAGIYRWAAAQPVPPFDPARVADDFLRWHLVLAKQRLDSLRAAKRRAVTPPAGPFGPGELAGAMQSFLAELESPEARADRLAGERREMRERWMLARAEIESLKSERRHSRSRRSVGGRLRAAFDRFLPSDHDGGSLAVSRPFERLHGN